MELTGVIKEIGQLQTFESGFKKINLILTTEDKYPQTIQIDFTGENVDLLDGYFPGDYVKIFINLRGREWTDPSGITKVFNSIVAWKIEKNEKVEDIPF